MPELPEVETIKLGLQKYLVGHTIVDVEVRLPRIFHGSVKNISGAKVISVNRYGKGLIIDLSNGYSLAVHVKMTGQLLYVSNRITRGPVSDPSAPVSLRSQAGSLSFASSRSLRPSPPATHLSGNLPDKHTHVVFSLDNKATLYYRDMRQFGWVKILPTAEALELPFFKNLGPEPLKDLTFEKFSNILSKAKTPIKLLIMDQSKMAGIGNIYANDALYRAKIHPRRAASSLSKKEQKDLFAAIKFVLKKGIEVGGASERDYVDVLGGQGKYQNFFLVYQKNGKKCKKCGTLIEKIVLGGRGTFFCRGCQPSKSVSF